MLIVDTILLYPTDIDAAVRIRHIPDSQARVARESFTEWKPSVCEETVNDQFRRRNLISGSRSHLVEPPVCGQDRCCSARENCCLTNVRDNFNSFTASRVCTHYNNRCEWTMDQELYARNDVAAMPGASRCCLAFEVYSFKMCKCWILVHSWN